MMWRHLVEESSRLQNYCGSGLNGHVKVRQTHARTSKHMDRTLYLTLWHKGKNATQKCAYWIDVKTRFLPLLVKVVHLVSFPSKSSENFKSWKWFHPNSIKKNVFNSDDFLESYDSLDLVYILYHEILHQYRRETISLWNAFWDSQTTLLHEIKALQQITNI